MWTDARWGPSWLEARRHRAEPPCSRLAQTLSSGAMKRACPTSTPRYAAAASVGVSPFTTTRIATGPSVPGVPGARLGRHATSSGGRVASPRCCLRRGPGATQGGAQLGLLRAPLGRNLLPDLLPDDPASAPISDHGPSPLQERIPGQRYNPTPSGMSPIDPPMAGGSQSPRRYRRGATTVRRSAITSSVRSGVPP